VEKAPPQDLEAVEAPGTSGDTGFLRMALWFYAALLAVAVLISALTGHSLLYADLAAAASGVAWLRDIGAGLLAAAVVIAVSALLTAHTRWGAMLSDALAALLGPLRPRTCWLLAAASGVAEEALFRGALQPQLGLVGASVVFGLAHFAPRRDLLPWTLFSLAAGFGLGALYAWTGNLLAPVVAHAGVNAVNLQLIARRASASPPGLTSP